MVMENKQFFPDGTPIDEWFFDSSIPNLESLGKRYTITDYGVCDDGKVYTKQIQQLIDNAANSGGGVIVVPKGTYYTGALPSL
jgi:polygalacturonase